MEGAAAGIPSGGTVKGDCTNQFEIISSSTLDVEWERGGRKRGGEGS